MRNREEAGEREREREGGGGGMCGEGWGGGGGGRVNSAPRLWVEKGYVKFQTFI